MCSTHKFVSAAAVLTLVDQGHMSLDKRVPYMRADLLDYAPINQGTCRRWFHDGGWPLCRRDRLERQHGGSDCSTVHRLDPLCSLARGHHLPARPYRAGLEHRDRRRSSHHNSRRGCTPISRMAGRSATSRDRAIMGPEMTSGSSSRLGAPPILATIYCTESAEPLSSREQVIAEVSQITASAADARMQTGSTHSRRNDTVSIT
jgi:hypothetical protein